MKRIILSVLTVLLVMVFSSANLVAEIKLPAIFCDNMVMQQQTQAAIWGKASKSSSVKVITSWNNKSYTTSAASDGTWKLKVTTPKAGGPYDITISDGKALKLQNILIGEVWVCSGQSNMEMPMKGYRNQPILGSSEAIAISSNPNIRLFTVQKATSLEPLDDFTGDWKMCEPGNVSEFSATAYYFGLMLQKALNVPVGLINTSWGGTRIEPWISESGIKNFDWVNLPEKKPVEKLSPQTPTVLFNAMINPIVGYGMRGAIWYQGESNRNEPQEYQKLMPGLVENWRSVWGIGEFPFYYVQIAPFDYGTNGLNSAYLREAQLKASTAIPNIGMVCIMDLGEKDIIHPAHKETGSNRLAYLALAQTYGIKGIASQSPVLKDMKVAEGVVKLTFDNAPDGLTSYSKELNCFEVAGANKRFFPAKAFITGMGITLMSPLVSEPVAVRYAFQDFIVGDLFGTNGLPVSSFRTDQWEPENK
ncbi:MAG TPA: sialate O-acetylesterase [Prolixibacteraceae bacterium]|nr:sialate O-acetylesterase [Prolixibacteraceae bacterium]